MSQKKIHKIKTVNDILKVITVENFERFTTDFLVIFNNLAKVKEIEKDFKIKEITWCDDNDGRVGYKFNDGKIIWDEKNKEADNE